MRKFLAGIAILSLLFLFGCNNPNGKPKDTPQGGGQGGGGSQESGGGTSGNEDPKLELVSITIAGTNILPAKFADEVWKVDVESTQDKLVSTDIKATFKYGNKTDSGITVKVDKEPLNEGKNDIVLTVDAVKTKHKGWTHKLEVTKKPVPDLTLVSANICGYQLPDTELAKAEWTEVVVPKSKGTLLATDVLLAFKYGKVNDVDIPVTFSKSALEPGLNTITLTVPAKDKTYKEWKHDVKIRRKSDIDFRFANLKVKVENKGNWESVKQQDGKIVVTVINSVTEIKSTDVEAYFMWDGIPLGTPVKLDCTYDASDFPISFAAGDDEKTKEITLKIAQDAGKDTEIKNEAGKVLGKVPEHAALEQKITIKRIAKPTLAKIKLHSVDFPEKEITDFSATSPKTENLGKTKASKINVYFYNNLGVEDPDLLARITTVPVLTKVASLQEWRLDKKKNKLEVKLDGTTVCTLNVEKEAIEVESIAVDENGTVITANAEEGKTYTAHYKELNVVVTPKAGYKYGTVTAKVGSASNSVNLTKNNQYSATDPYRGKITIEDSVDNEITVTVNEEGGGTETALVRKFKIKKEAAAVNVDEKVKIKNLWLGNGMMKKDNSTKFKAEADSSDPTLYKVKVNKYYYKKSDLLVSLIVEGDSAATAAKIAEEGNTEEGTADGATVFNSKLTYSKVKSASNTYKFKLKNADKEQEYTVVLDFSVDVEYTITIDPAITGGQIKAWIMKGVSRQEITVSGNSFKAKNNTTLYIEIVAEAGKQPETLVVLGKTYKDLNTQKSFGQTQDSIAAKIPSNKFFEDFTITGTCK